MIKQYWRWFALCLICYLFFIIANFPAQQILGRITLPKNILIFGTSGTIWQGEVSLLRIANVSLNKLSWSLGTDGFMPAVHVLFNNPVNVNGKSTISWHSGLAVTETNIHLSVENILNQLTLPLPGSASGKMQLVLKNAQLTEQFDCQQLNGTLYWTNGNINTIVGNVRLDDSVLTFDCQNGKVVMDWTQASDEIEVKAKITLDKQRYLVNATITPGETLSPAIKQGLSQAGKADTQGRIVINLNNTW